MKKLFYYPVQLLAIVLIGLLSKATYVFFVLLVIGLWVTQDYIESALLLIGPAAVEFGKQTIWPTIIALSLVLGWMFKREKKAQGDLGSAKFENNLADLSRKKSIFIDLKKRFEGNEPLILAQAPKKNEFLSIDKGHLLCVAPTRSGKGVSSIIPNLLTLKTSVFCLDIKGENYAVTATRGKFSRVGVIDIFDQVGRDKIYINPLAGIDALTPQGQRKISGIVDALVYDDSGGGADPHWNESAKQLVKTLTILAVIEMRTPCLVHVRDMLFLDINDLFEMVGKYQGSKISFLRNAANSIISKNEREFSSILSTAQRHLDFLQDMSVEAYFSMPGNASFSDLASSLCSYYLIIPPDLLEFSKRIIRLMIDQALFENMNQVKKDIVFVLDEFAQLGRLERIEQAVTLAAGYGIRVMMYVQDIAQLKQAYKEKWSSFAANSTMQFFGVNDFETAKYLSDSLGIETTRLRSAGESTGESGKGIGEKSSRSSGDSWNESVSKRNLMNPDEIMNMPAHHTIIITAGKRPIKAAKTGYIYDKAFSGLYYGNPFYQ